MEGLDVEPNRLTYGVSLAEKLFRHALSQNGHHRVVQHVAVRDERPRSYGVVTYRFVLWRDSQNLGEGLVSARRDLSEMADGLLSGGDGGHRRRVSGVQQRVRVVHGQRLGTV